MVIIVIVAMVVMTIRGVGLYRACSGLGLFPVSLYLSLYFPDIVPQGLVGTTKCDDWTSKKAHWSLIKGVAGPECVPECLSCLTSNPNLVAVDGLISISERIRDFR